MRNFLGTDGHGFEKGTASCAMDKGFICIRAILKVQTCSFPQSKLSRELAKQAVITKCRGYIYAEPSRVFLQKAVDFRAKQKSVLICDNLWTKNSVDFRALIKSVLICGQKKSDHRWFLQTTD